MPRQPQSAVTARRTARRTAIADAVLELLSVVGSRGVTHRAVDRALGLPDGSTSAYYRTRASLLTAAAHRLADVDTAAITVLIKRIPRDPGPGAPAALIAAVVESLTSPEAVAHRQIARLELMLEARRNAALAEVLTRVRAQFVELARHALADPAAGSDLAGTLTAVIDGLVFGRLLHPVHTPIGARQEAALTELLHEKLARGGAPRAR